MSRLRPYLQLVRLPAVFTSLADILLGALALGVQGAQWLTVALLCVTSACLYLSGMAWNDFFDLDQDRKERPSRPIPSGRVSRLSAAKLAIGLMLVGLIFSFLAGWSVSLIANERGRGPYWMPLFLACCLVVMILAYDAILKRFWAGPLGMGACRFLNVLLGLTALGAELPGWGVHLAAVVGLYIVGVTWFARCEASVSQKKSLIGAALTMLASAALALTLAARLSPDTSSFLFPYLLVLLLFIVGFPVCRAIANPTPLLVQAAVKRCLQGLVFFDAVLASIWVGWVGLLILLLLVPIHYLSRWRWLYMT